MRMRVQEVIGAGRSAARRTAARAARTLAAALALGVGAPVGAVAQADSVVVAAGPEYAATPLQRVLLGDDYRGLWTTPMRVERLDLARFAGGLVPTERGGGRQTRVLHLRGADGREYVFRSVNKDPSLLDTPAFRGTMIGGLVRDQTSSLHPAAALVADALLEAAGVLHPSPRLVVLPDDARLGEFRAEFGGMLGMLEERPNEGEDGAPGFGGFRRIVSTERLLERIEEDPRERVDARAFLTARLMDLLLGDWDRHYDQWRWAEVEHDGGSRWLPIPRDRDYVFAHYDGWLPALAREVMTNAVRFGPRIDNLYNLSLAGQALDRRILPALERAAWDSVAADLQRRLSDEAIAAAVRRMPPELAARSADRLAELLRSRRDQLPALAGTYYRLLAEEVEVHTTDEPEIVRVDRAGEGVLDVRIYVGGDTTGAPYFQRRFLREDTREVRLHLHGGDDHAVVRGEVRRNPAVRIVGGGGDDVLVDSSAVGAPGSGTALYDSRGDNRLVPARGTTVDERPFEGPPLVRSLTGQQYRDWGSSGGWSGSLGYQDHDGPIVGVGRSFTRYGFRRIPYAYRLSARGRVGLASGNAAASLRAEVIPPASTTTYSLLLRASQLDLLRFHGFGNETAATEESDRYVVPHHRVELRAAVEQEVLPGTRVRLGPVVRYTNPDLPDDHPVGALPPYGTRGFGQLGAELGLGVRSRGAGRLDLPGVRVEAAASAFPGVWSASDDFGLLHGQLRGYLPLPLPGEQALALRAGGARAWGAFPVHEAAVLGGSRTLRGFSSRRFTGDAAVHGGAELRAKLFPVRLLLRGDLGALAFGDAGRVYVDGASPGGWHTAVGAGLWFRFELYEEVTTVSLSYARGERGVLYALLGFPF